MIRQRVVWIGVLGLLTALGLGLFFYFEGGDLKYRWIGNNKWAARQGCNVNISPQDQRWGPSYFRIWGRFHTISRLLPADDYYESHPEYFALVDGQREPDQPCLSNAAVQDIVAENLLEVVDGNPELNMLTLGLPDNRKFCECDRCTGIDEADVPADQTYSRRVLMFYKTVAKQVHAVYPEMPIRFGFYDVYAAPPAGADLPKNCVPFICHFQKYCNNHPVASTDCAYNARFRDIIQRWSEAADTLFIYEYYYKVNWLGLPWPLVHAIKEDIAWYKENGVTGLYSQYHQDCLGSALNVYVAANLTKNMNADVEALVTRFCRNHFGPAWFIMRRYYLFLEQAMQSSGLHIPGRGFAFPHAPEVFTAEVLAKCDALLLQAQKHVRGSHYEEAVNKQMILMAYTKKCVRFLRQARQALGEERLGVKQGNCHPQKARTAFDAGVRLQKELENRRQKYRGVLPSPANINPYLRKVLQALYNCMPQK